MSQGLLQYCSLEDAWDGSSMQIARVGTGCGNKYKAWQPVTAQKQKTREPFPSSVVPPKQRVRVPPPSPRSQPQPNHTNMTCQQILSHLSQCVACQSCMRSLGMNPSTFSTTLPPVVKGQGPSPMYTSASLYDESQRDTTGFGGDYINPVSAQLQQPCYLDSFDYNSSYQLNNDSICEASPTPRVQPRRQLEPSRQRVVQRTPQRPITESVYDDDKYDIYMKYLPLMPYVVAVLFVLLLLDILLHLISAFRR